MTLAKGYVIAFLVSLLLVLAGTVPGRPGQAETVNLYVATNGNDAWSGTLPATNDAKTDGPLASLEAARDALRTLRKAQQLPGGANVHVRGGSYPLAKTFVLSEADSGTETAPIVYRAYEKEAVSLSGARAVAGFRPVQDQGILSRLDPAARANVLQANLKAQGITDFGEPTAAGKRPDLLFQDRPMTLARWPNNDFARVGTVKGATFAYDGDRPERWSAERDVWLHGYWFYDWSDSYQKVEAVRAKERLLALAPPQHHYGYRQGQRYYALNVLAELDAPGEWYLDRQTGLLYFWPPGPVAEARVALSVVPTLVRLENASWVTLRGLTLEGCRDNAVGIRGGTGDVLAGCVVRNTGGWGVEVAGGKGHRVVGCDVYQTGRGGIRVEGGDRATLTPASHVVENNHVHHFERLFRTYQPAVELQGVGLRMSRNLIHDAPHAAIHLDGNDHVVELNEVHGVCRETCDVGALYLGRDWTMRGNVIRRNYLHDIAAPVALSSMAVYLDDAASGFIVDGNIFHRVQYAVFVGGGRDNRIENNVFVDCKLALHVDARGVGWMKNDVETILKPRLRAVPYQQPPWSRRYPSLVNILSDEPGLPKGDVVTRNISVGGPWADIEVDQPYCLH